MEPDRACHSTVKFLDWWSAKKSCTSGIEQSLHRRQPQEYAPKHLNYTDKMSAPSLATFIAGKPWLSKMMMPLANWYCNAAGYRKLGLRYATNSWGERGVNDSTVAMSACEPVWIGTDAVDCLGPTI